jgi:hypothetical protein
MEEIVILGIEEQRLLNIIFKIENLKFDLGTFSDLIFSRANDDRPESNTEEAHENFFQFSSRILTHYKYILAAVQDELCNLNRLRTLTLDRAGE